MMPSRGIDDDGNTKRISPEDSSRTRHSMRKRRRIMEHSLLVRYIALVTIGIFLFTVTPTSRMVYSHPLLPPYDNEIDEPYYPEEEVMVSKEMLFANDTLLGHPLRCTKEEKECFRFNRIYFFPDGRCYPLGTGPGHCRFAVDRCDFERKNRVRGVCAPTDLCWPLSANLVKAAYTGRCMKPRDLLSACGPGPVNLIQHFFGDTECSEPQGITSPTRVYIPQPKQDGRCVFPNLRNDLSSVSNQENFVHFKACSQEQSVCFAAKKVWNAANRSCSDLLKPCDDGAWVALNRTAWEEGRVEAACLPVHPCGKRSRLMAFDRRCYDGVTVLRVLCPGGVLLPNAFGEMSCVTRDYYRHVIDVESNRPTSCEVTQRVSFFDEPVAARLKPDCKLNARGRCGF